MLRSISLEPALLGQHRSTHVRRPWQAGQAPILHLYLRPEPEGLLLRGNPAKTSRGSQGQAPLSLGAVLPSGREAGSSGQSQNRASGSGAWAYVVAAASSTAVGRHLPPPPRDHTLHPGQVRGLFFAIWVKAGEHGVQKRCFAPVGPGGEFLLGQGGR